MRHGRLWIYFFLLSVQTLGIALIVWEGVPVYRRVVAGSVGPHATADEMIGAATAVVLIQGAYWLRSTIVPSLKLRPNIFLSHVALFIGRVSFILGTALFTAIVYYRPPEIQLAPLLHSSFSSRCYSLCFVTVLNWNVWEEPWMSVSSSTYVPVCDHGTRTPRRDLAGPDLSRRSV